MLLLLLRIIEASGVYAAAATAVLVRHFGHAGGLHVAASHVGHLVAFVTGDLWLVDAELAEIAFEVGIVLQAHNRVLVLHDLLAHVGTVLLVCIQLLVWLLEHVGLPAFCVERRRLHHASFTTTTTTTLIKLH